ncbi:penicillin-binding transpeptidase domain-containing protein [Streptomyces sp. B-S-A8]|uniref:Penicillin-binding transpeptidase domain-containing protein n=2 Tax=Streptomyces solicavernae TaxID=3043614 RepID=A0ABT6RQA7_9ACTN|nr:penicillin-binding transpeptidase domain-containing protein [Streptomyces sp. B-S-A8]MDI3386608.1 penicillin-binding transpeptidase domain-containing protein [Streptomyces sp. B-S-A8]
MRKEAKVTLIGAAVVAVAAGAGFTAYALTGGGSESGGAQGGDRTAAGEPKKELGPPSAAEVKSTTAKFLTAWSKGDVAAAAAQTDDAAAARTALTSYREDAHLTKVELTPGTASGRKVPFSVSAVASYEATSKPFTYDSELTVVRDEKTDKPVVHWQPSVVHPELREGDVLRADESGKPPIKAVDRDGAELSAEKYPSLGTVLDSLREKYGDKAGGEPAVELRIVRGESTQKPGKSEGAEESDESDESGKSDDKALSDKTLLTLSKGTPGTVETTISAKAQANAEAEVAKRQDASVVLLKPSTGEVLAVANSNTSGLNIALQGSLAPGSTFKIVSASMLLEKGLAGIDKPHPCPKYETYGGWRFQNVEKFEIKNGTFRSSFAASCNTAFISQAKKLKDDDLTQQAQEVFGLGKGNWTSGVSTFDGRVPVQSDAQMAASLIGQGGVRMNPLNVASFIATAKTGTFRQPYLVSPEVDGRTLATAPRKLKPSAQAQLKELLTYTATSGSAAAAMSGLGPDIGGKTGSAEVMGQKKPNGWFTAWRGDLAAAAVMLEGGRGGSSSGPLVAAVLKGGA